MAVAQTPVQQDKTGFVENEPVIVAHFVIWLLANLGALIIGHTHLFTADQWSSMTTGLIPVITAVLLGVIATVVRKYVAPFWKKFEQTEVKLHLPVLTASQLDAVVGQILEALMNQQKANVPLAIPKDVEKTSVDPVVYRTD